MPGVAPRMVGKLEGKPNHTREQHHRHQPHLLPVLVGIVGDQPNTHAHGVCKVHRQQQTTIPYHGSDTGPLLHLEQGQFLTSQP